MTLLDKYIGKISFFKHPFLRISSNLQRALDILRSHGQLILFGTFSLILYLWMTELSRQFNWGEGYADRPILTYLAIYFALFIQYACACQWISKEKEKRFSLWIIIIWGLMFRAILIPSNQIQEDDVYRYMWDGKVFAEGINPYKYAPAEVNGYMEFKIQEPENFEKTYTVNERQELERLNKLKWENDAALTTLERVNHPDVPTIYPPMAQLVFRLVASAQPDSILAMRLAFLVFDLLTLFFIIKILGALNKNLNLCLVYFWSPLVIKETFNSTHLDIIGIAFLCASIYLLILHRHILAMLCLAGGVLGKLYPAILLPFYLERAALQSQISRNPMLSGMLQLLLVFAGAVLIGYLPFTDTGLKTFAGLKTFSTYWQSNDSVFSLLVFFFEDVLRLKTLELTVFSNDLPTFLSKVAVVLILLAVLFHLLFKRNFLQKPRELLLRSLFILMALVFILSPVQNPWYLLWVVPFLCLFPMRSWILLTGLVGLYYLDFYFDYQDIPQYSAWIPWLEYTPFYIYLAYELLKSSAKKAGPTTQAAA